jgi:AcrR family transcriptional regulator
MAKSSANASDTKTRLLDAAEALIASQGIAATSVREITEKAGVNLALVSYHFRNKDGLLEAMLKRRMDPINDARLELLAQLDSRHPSGLLPLEGVLECLIRPVVEQCLGHGKEGAQFLRVFGRIFAEPAASMRLLHKHMRPMIKKYDDAFDRALPGMPAADIMWRKMATLGVVQHSLLMLAMLDELPLMLRIPVKLIKGAPDPETTLAQLVAFCAAGMRAKVVPL